MAGESMAHLFIKVLAKVLDTLNNCKSYWFCDAMISLRRLHSEANIGNVWVVPYGCVCARTDNLRSIWTVKKCGKARACASNKNLFTLSRCCWQDWSQWNVASPMSAMWSCSLLCFMGMETPGRNQGWRSNLALCNCLLSQSQKDWQDLAYPNIFVCLSSIKEGN